VYVVKPLRLAACLALLTATWLVGLSGSVLAETQPDPRAARPLVVAGISAYESGDYAKAIDNLKRAQQADPSHSPTALYLGLAYLKQNDLSDAIVAWEKYIKLKPYTKVEQQNDLQETVRRDLMILLRERDHQQALEQIAHERELGPGSPEAVAISYYRNLGSPELTPLQKGLTALIIADVSEVPELKVVERDRLQALIDEMKLGSSGLVDPKTAAHVGHLLGAGRVATGSYLDPTKGEMRINSVLAQTSSGQVLGDQQAAGKLVQFYNVEKALAAEILTGLGYDQNRLRAEGVLVAVQTPQTTSFPAFEAFSRGLDAKDRQDYPGARAAFQQALSFDPRFAAAQRELLHTPLAPLSVGQVSSSVSAAAPTVEVATAGMAGPQLFSGGVPIPFGGVPPPVCPVLVCPDCAIHVGR